MVLKRTNRRGFTLIEVLLSLAIYTIIGLATVRQLQQIKNTKDIAFEDMEIYNATRAAVSLIRQDISQAFHVRLDDLGEDSKKAFKRGEDVARTLFDGRKNELVFTSLSHRVYYAGRRETEQCEISYFLQNRDDGVQVLMKRESPTIDDRPYEGGQIFTVLEYVDRLQFQYWDPKKLKWVDDWSSDQGEFQDLFPPMVRMILRVKDTAGKTVDIDTNMKVAFTNNQPVLVKIQ